MFFKRGGWLKRLFSKGSKSLDIKTQEVLYHQFFEIVYRTAYRYCGEHLSSQDIVHETFIRAFKYISTYKKDKNGSFEGWLVTIAKNESLKYLKKSWQRNELPSEEISSDRESFIISDSVTIESQVITKLKIEDLMMALDNIKLQNRQIILLHLFHDYTFKEIGELLGIKENAARQSYHRAKKEIAANLELEWGEDHEE